MLPNSCTVGASVRHTSTRTDFGRRNIITIAYNAINESPIFSLELKKKNPSSKPNNNEQPTRESLTSSNPILEQEKEVNSCVLLPNNNPNARIRDEHKVRVKARINNDLHAPPGQSINLEQKTQE